MGCKGCSRPIMAAATSSFEVSACGPFSPCWNCMKRFLRIGVWHVLAPNPRGQPPWVRGFPQCAHLSRSRSTAGSMALLCVRVCWNCRAIFSTLIRACHRLRLFPNRCHRARSGSASAVSRDTHKLLWRFVATMSDLILGVASSRIWFK